MYSFFKIFKVLFPDGVLIDPMHLVHLGIYKKMLDFYFNTEFKDSEFYLGEYDY